MVGKERITIMSVIGKDHIRNFCIVAHIDHGKSTLADRIIERTGLLTSREMQAQVLDNMELERERGITIKSQAVRLAYTAKNGEEYLFNLIDTPGHVDFNYEVSRSLAACEGAILIVDAAQGIEAQTLANCYLAIDHDLEIMPVINKIDLPSADPDRVKNEIEDVIGIEAQDAPLISAKLGTNIEEVLEQIVKKIPAPQGDDTAPLKALVFDSVYDSYKGVIIFCRLFDGTVKKGTKIHMMATGLEEEVVEVGTFGAGQFIPCEELTAGMVGYITASLKNVEGTRVGDTVTDAENPCKEALPGYKKVMPMVYCGLYPADGAKYQDLRDALEKLQLNDASLQFEAETSVALGFGFRCGFLGLLHLEVIQERLEREYNLDLVTTAPGVVYHVYKTNGEMVEVTNPSNLPDPSEIEHMEEPVVDAEIMVTTEFVGAIMKLCQERRGVYQGMEYMEETRALLKYTLPLNEIIYDFFDSLKSRSRSWSVIHHLPSVGKAAPPFSTRSPKRKLPNPGAFSATFSPLPIAMIPTTSISPSETSVSTNACPVISKAFENKVSPDSDGFCETPRFPAGISTTGTRLFPSLKRLTNFPSIWCVPSGRGFPRFFTRSANPRGNSRN